MIQGCENALQDSLPLRAPHIAYRTANVARLLHAESTLALFGFGKESATLDDPGFLRVVLDPLDTPAPYELWQVEAPVSRGSTGKVQWSAGGGWLFAAIELDEGDYGGPGATAQHAYDQLRQFIASRRECQVLRIWNYLADINEGSGDAERYKQFCEGRALGSGNFFAQGFPAATAIGHHGAQRRLQIYLLACDQPGIRVENPRQISAWRYPRQYGRTPPSFARAMCLPAQDVLAISGTASVVGHESLHANDLDAQLDETLVNLEALLASSGMGAGFDTHSPLKAYVRYAADAARVRAFMQHRLPGVPVMLLHGDICRSELLVEIDGWRYT